MSPKTGGAGGGGRGLDWPILGLLLLFLAGAVIESLGFAAKAAGALGWAAANRGDSERALELSGRALDLNSWDDYALYLSAVKQRERNRTEAFAKTLPRLLLVHPNQASVRRLAGEAAYGAADYKMAAEYLWQALEINPTPPGSPANFWRMAMMASQKSGDAERARRAAYRAVALADGDQMLSKADHAALEQDAGYVFSQAGAKALGSHLAALARLEKARLEQRRPQ